MKNKFYIYIFAASLCIVASCAKEHKIAPQLTPKDTTQLVEDAKAAALSSMKEKNRGPAKEFAEKGIKIAEDCIAVAPREAACYYWHAVNTGLYYKIRIIGYQRGVKKMIADCENVIALEPSYDNAGALRMLGLIYTQLPQTGGNIESVIRDLPLAEKYLRRAVDIAPDYPENQLALAETLYEEEMFSESLEHLNKAKSNLNEWKNDVSFKDWQKTIKWLSKKLLKKTK